MAWDGLDGVPDVTDCRAWAGVPVTEFSDDQMALVLSSEAEVQQAFCSVDAAATVLPDPLVQALLRRVARSVAARGVPLGTLPSSMTGVPDAYGTGIANGPALLPQLDAEVERLEAAWRVIPVA